MSLKQRSRKQRVGLILSGGARGFANIGVLRASSCFPGAFEPVKFQGRLLADGGIVNNLPVNAVSFLNASFTIASDTTPPRHMIFADDSDDHWWERMMATVKLERRNPVAQMMIRSTDIMQSILTDIHYSMHPADVLVRHTMPGINLESFRNVEDIILLAEQEAFRTFREVGLLEPLTLTSNNPIADHNNAETNNNNAEINNHNSDTDTANNNSSTLPEHS
jgi:predicted acylesterase/phospholipase RssA